MVDQKIDKVLWSKAKLVVYNDGGFIISKRILRSVDIMERIDDKTKKSIICLNALVEKKQ